MSWSRSGAKPHVGAPTDQSGGQRQRPETLAPHQNSGPPAASTFSNARRIRSVSAGVQPSGGATATTPPPGLRPAAVALRATQNSGLALAPTAEPRIPRVNLPMAAPFGLGSRRGICVYHRRCGTTSSARRERPLVHIRTRICAGDPVPLKPATLLPSSATICRSGILKRLAGASSLIFA